MTTIAAVQVCGSYHQHIPGWLDSVRGLTRQPDQVVLVAAPHPSLADVDLDGVTLATTTDPFSWGTWLNMAVALTDADWISWPGIDDRYLPHALDLVDDCDADVLAHGIEYTTGPVWIPADVTAEAVLRLSANLIPVGAPFRRTLWQSVPFTDELCADWYFWASCAWQGATFAHTGRVDVIYEYGPDHVQPDAAATRIDIQNWLPTLERA